MKPREYQIEALDCIYEDLQKNQNVLLRAIMGAGKTFMSVALIKRLKRERPAFRFLILAHKKELVEQFASAFDTEVGICCAGLKQRDITCDITIATIQSFIRMVDDYSGADLIVVDECHAIPFHDRTSRYRQVLDALMSKKPNCRILGLTATPARLGHGYIYGSRCKPGEPNLFDRENYAVGYDRLVKEGYLVPLKGKIAAASSIKEDLAGVSINGDYVLNQLGEIMSRERHVATAAQAIRDNCEGYKCICVFCCTIDHAEKVHEALLAYGEDVTIVHSRLSDIERSGNMAAWKEGRARIIVSVNILIEGFDLPRLDCLVMVRPTLSSTLFLQAVGRVLRNDGVKTHGMLLDLTDNVNRFGTDLDNVKVTIPKAAEDIEKKEQELTKLCPSCEREVSVYLRVCECGYEWPPAECTIAQTVPDLVEVEFKKPDPVVYDVSSITTSVHLSRKTNKMLGKIDIHCNDVYQPISAWFCLPDFYSGYAVQKSRQRWKDFSDFPFPEDVDEFRTSCFIIPKTISVDPSSKYPEIISVEKGEVDMFENAYVTDEIPF